jgi:hypothetical protein
MKGEKRMSRATKTLVGVVLRVWGGGKATLLTVMVALTLATVTPAFAANGGNFILGSLNNTATAITRLVGTVAGPALWVVNPSKSAAATGALFQVAPGHPPFKVNSATKVLNLNADKVDGLDSTQLQGALAYAHINSDGTLDASRSKNVDKSAPFGGNSYCINSTVTPHNVVATIDQFNGGPGEITARSDNGRAVCSFAATGDYNISVNTYSSAGTAIQRPFYVVIN